MYRLAHVCSFKINQDILGASKLLATFTFNNVMKVLVSTLFNEFLKLLETDGEGIAECKGFIENYEFPCADAGDDCHVHVSMKLKKYCAFKNSYTIYKHRFS